MKENINKLIQDNDMAFYVFDIEALKKRIAFLRNSLPDNTKICYAIKANPFVVKEIINDIDRFEVCSAGEEDICRTLNVPEVKTVVSGVYKTPELIEKNISTSPTNEQIYTAESLLQYKLLSELSEKYNARLKVLLRLTNNSQFGMNEEDIEDIFSKAHQHANIEIIGIQYFSGTQKTSVKKFHREIEYLDAFISRLENDLGYKVSELEYGPGFPVSYFESDELDENELFREFSLAINSMQSKPKLTLEIGRSLSACCGKYYTHVVDIKCNKNQNYLLMDGGMHHLVYFGQHMAMKQPILSVYGKENEKKDKIWTICGCLCSMNDIMAKQVALPEINIKDVLCFENTGAYCMAEGISLFLSRDLPKVYLMLEDKTTVCVRRAFQSKSLNTPLYERID